MKANHVAQMMNLRESTPDFSNGQLQNMYNVINFKSWKSHEESGSANIDAITEALPALQEKKCMHELKDIYNMDETELLQSMSPGTTLAKQQIKGSKKDKTRITIALTSNANGSDKLESFIIGHEW